MIDICRIIIICDALINLCLLEFKMSQNKIDIGGAGKMAEALLVRPWTPVNRMLQNLILFATFVMMG